MLSSLGGRPFGSTVVAVAIGGKLCPRQSLRAGISAAVCARSREGEWYPLTLILPPLTSILLYKETACNLQSNTPLQ